MISVGAVTLGVADLQAQSAFYQEIIGLGVLNQSSTEVELGVGKHPLVKLISRPGGILSPSSTGLFHLAILLPSRSYLGAWLRHFVQSGGQLEGSADHLVSEALYLRDPEGNGIEMYCDRPRNQWSYNEQYVKMDTLPLNLQSLLAEEKDLSFEGLPAGTMMGHVHLQVNDLNQNLAFYRDIVGFKVMAFLPGASFLGDGGYHHHIGINTWRSRNATPPPNGSLGLIRYELNLGTAAKRNQLLDKLDNSKVFINSGKSIPSITDPAGNEIVLTAL